MKPSINEISIKRTLLRAKRYLDSHTTSQLLNNVGKRIKSIPIIPHFDKRYFQKSYAGNPDKPQNDVITGRGLFYITELGNLFLDTTAGHYQMTWGYNNPELNATIQEGVKNGIIWDCHSSIPGDYVKKLSYELIDVCGSPQLDTVMLGTASGSMACSTAMKIAIKYFRKAKGEKRTPVFISLNGNYHGTDIMMQRLRGMWTPYFSNCVFETVEPNDISGLKKVFKKHGKNVSAFFFEPILMNRESLLLQKDFVKTARELTESVDAIMAIDEIQTGFWVPEVLMFKQFGIIPDIVIIGKGLTAGFHPLSGIIYRKKYDILEQYDSLNTNGNPPLPAYVALKSIEMVKRDSKRISTIGNYYHNKLKSLAGEFHGIVKSIQGQGLLSGIKFKDQPIAIDFHRKCFKRGIWLRVHAYHEGHSTALTKFALVVDKETIDFTISEFRKILNR